MLLSPDAVCLRVFGLKLVKNIFAVKLGLYSRSY